MSNGDSSSLTAAQLLLTPTTSAVDPAAVGLNDTTSADSDQLAAVDDDFYRREEELDELGFSKGGKTKISEIPVKDVIIVIFMLGLWLYSILLIVRAWAKVHVLPGNYMNNLLPFAIRFEVKC